MRAFLLDDDSCHSPPVMSMTRIDRVEWLEGQQYWHRPSPTPSRPGAEVRLRPAAVQFLGRRGWPRNPTRERQRLGVHTCPDGDRDSTHSADVDYAQLLSALFRFRVGRFYVQLASERDPERVLGLIRQYGHPDQMVFVGVTDPINPVVETAEQVRDRTLLAARFIPVSALGTTDDCGFSPFADDVSTSREIAFAKIHARVAGPRLASQHLGQG